MLSDKRLTGTDKKMIPERNVEPVLTMENIGNEEIEQMINIIRKGEKIIQQGNKQTKLNRKIIKKYNQSNKWKLQKEKTL